MIGISTRVWQVDYANGSSETRDCLDRAWHSFLAAALPDELIVILPNIGAKIAAMLDHFPFTGFILSGGADWGIYPERDETEKLIFARSHARKLPVIGVCRGAQVINHLLGGLDVPLAGHAGARHEIDIQNAPAGWHFGDSLEVNSYHNNAIAAAGLAPKLSAFAVSGEFIEGFTDGGEILGVMWHPERETVPAEHDKWLFQKFLAREGEWKPRE